MMGPWGETLAAGSVLATLIVLVAVVVGVLHLRRKLGYIYRRVLALEEHVTADTEQRLSRHFRQVEALVGLYAVLRPDRDLPETRGWAASPDFLLGLVAHAMATKPRVIVECGSGVSTVLLARCLSLNGSGQIYSLEHLPEFRERTVGELARHGVASWAAVLDAPLREYALPSGTWLWYSLDELPVGEIDMLVVDGPPGTLGPLARYPAGPLLFGRLARNATIFVDDMVRADEQTMVARWIDEHPDLAQEIRACEKGCVILRHCPR
jgi:Methyltransferase domain